VQFLRTVTDQVHRIEYQSFTDTTDVKLATDPRVFAVNVDHHRLNNDGSRFEAGFVVKFQSDLAVALLGHAVVLVPWQHVKIRRKRLRRQSQQFLDGFGFDDEQVGINAHGEDSKDGFL
jgi:hypothetical protein